jgi:hypothetical protein
MSLSGKSSFQVREKKDTGKKSVMTIDDIQVIKLCGNSAQYIDTSLDRDRHLKNNEYPVLKQAKKYFANGTKQVPIYEANKMIVKKRKMKSKKSKPIEGANKSYAKSITKSSLDINVFNNTSIHRSSSQPVKKYHLSPYKSKNIAKKNDILRKSIIELKNDFSFKKPVKVESSKKKGKFMD